MKKSISACVFLFLATTSAFCQHFYLQPTAGIALTNAKLTAEAPVTAVPYEAGLGYVAGVRAGIDFQGLRIGTGVEMLHVATRYNSPIGTDITNTYDHLLIPVTASYSIPTGSKLSIVPSAGAAVSINFFDPGLPFKKTSIWGLAQADLEYALHDRLSITAGPRVYYMLNSIVQQPVGSLGNVKQWHYAMSLSAGVLLHL